MKKYNDRVRVSTARRLRAKCRPRQPGVEAFAPESLKVIQPKPKHDNTSLTKHSTAGLISHLRHYEYRQYE